MRASEVIEELQKLIKSYGDCYTVYPTRDNWDGAEKVEDINVIENNETKYFLIG
jgi:hypothetical protein